MKPLLVIVILMEAFYLGHSVPHSVPTRTVTFHIDYDAYEDMASCPGTPGKVVEYKPFADGSADIVCRIK